MTFRSLSLVAVLFPMWVTAQRLSVNIDSWEFSRDQQHWQQVSVPHDWAIAGPFDKKWDLQYVAITQNGETEKSEKSGGQEHCLGLAMAITALISMAVS